MPDILAARAMLSAKSGAGLVRCDPARIQRHQVAAPAHRIVSEGRQVTIILGTTTRLWHEGGLTNDLVAQVMARVWPVSVSSLSTVLNTAEGGLASFKSCAVKHQRSVSFWVGNGVSGPKARRVAVLQSAVAAMWVRAA